ncbi:MAG: RNA polymerase sigma factor [Phycisphaerae bacterium]
MRQLAAGDLTALDRLVRRHQGRAQALAYRLCGDHQTAEDLAQEAFLRVYRAAGRYEPRGAFSTWLHRIIVNLYLDALKARRPAVPLDDARNLPDQRTGEDPLAARERDAAIRREIARLPDRQRIALVLHCYEGHSHAEIAEITGWSESAVESLLTRAYRNLRDALRGWRDSA